MATVAKDFVVRNGVTAGTLVKGQTLESTVTTGTAPLTVASTTAVTNLNADQLDGYHASSFILGSALTTSAHLAGMLSDETGSDKVVFNTSPTFVTSVLTSSSTFAVFNTTATTINAFGAATTLNIGAGTGTTTINNDLVVSGGLTVNGTVTTVNSTTITVDDKNLELGSTGSPSDAAADGGGITLKGTTDKTILWTDATDSWTFNQHLALGASGKLYFNNGTTSYIDHLQYTGNAATATKWATSRTVTFATGDVTGSFSIDGSADVSNVALTIAANSVALGTDTTGNYIATIAGTANQVNVSGSGSETAAVTLSTPQDIATSSSPQFATVNLGTVSDITSDSVTVSANSTPTTIDSFLVASFTTAEYLVQAKQGTKMTTTHLTVMWDGTDVSIDEWGVMDAAAGAANATFTATHAAGTVTVSASSSDAATTNVVIKAATTYIAA